MFNLKNLFVLLFVSGFILGQQRQILHECQATKIRNFKQYENFLDTKYPGDQSIDVTYYGLNLNISYSPQQIIGAVRIDGKSLQDDLTNFFLDLQNSLTTDSVKSGNELLTFTHTNNKLNITLPAALNNGDAFSVTVYYHGVPGTSGFGSFEFSSHAGNPIIWTLSEPYGASDWFPCKDTPADKADSSDVVVTADEIFYTISNGSLVSDVNNGDGTRTIHWKNHHPIAHYLISLAMTNYEEYQNTFTFDGQTIPVRHFNWPENLDDSRRASLDKTVDMLQYYSETFGIYPYMDEKYGHAEFGWGGGMEHQTITSLGAYGETIIAHELAHQWFGDKVTCADWRNIWINEGFATYCEALWLGHAYGDDQYDNRIQTYMNYAKYAEGSIYVQNIGSVWEIFDYYRSYAKAAVVLHMLRGIIGDEAFFETLRTYLNKPGLAYNVATTEDFQAVAEEISGQDLDYFFSEWIYGENYPHYTLSWRRIHNNDGTYTAEITVNQSTNSTPRFFTMPLQFKIYTLGSDTLVTLFNNSLNQTFDVILEYEPTIVKFDPNNWILKDANQPTDIDEENNNPIKFELSQNYPNPFNPTTKISYSIPTASVIVPPKAGERSVVNVVLTVYNTLGQKVATLVNKKQSPGLYEVQFDASDLPSGIYFYTLRAGDFVATKKMILMK